jgi:DedD protein
MAESEDVNTLKRRGRRRLVGAIALVLAAVIVLPMVFDTEPRSSAPPVSVRIPSEDESGFIPKVTPKTPPAPPVEQKAAPKAPEKAPEKAVEKAPEPVVEKSEPKAEPKAEIKITKTEAPAMVAAAERAKAEAALAGGEQFVVPAGAYVDPAGVIEKLKEAKIPFYTEPIATKSGTVMRVRAGPFASRDAADKVQKQLKDLGLKPGNVATKS